MKCVTSAHDEQARIHAGCCCVMVTWIPRSVVQHLSGTVGRKRRPATHGRFGAAKAMSDAGPRVCKRLLARSELVKVHPLTRVGYKAVSGLAHERALPKGF